MCSRVGNLVRDGTDVDGDCVRVPTAIEIPSLAFARFPEEQLFELR
jgi:hypothetical protein